MNLPHNADSKAQREILDALPALVFLERSGRIVYANAEALAAMGMTAAEWAPQWTEEVLWGLFSGVAEPQTAIAGNRSGRRFHATLAGKNGRIVAVEGVYSIVNAQRREGVIVAHIARERIPRPRLMEDVLASLPEAVALVRGGRILYVNASFTRLFGYSEDEASGQDLLDLIVPDTRHEESAMLWRAIEEQGHVSTETVRMRKSGELVDVTMQIAPLMVNGAEAGYVLTYCEMFRQGAGDEEIAAVGSL